MKTLSEPVDDVSEGVDEADGREDVPGEHHAVQGQVPRLIDRKINKDRINKRT